MPDLAWQKSSFSSGDGNTTCVEIATDAGGRSHLRESDAPASVLEPTAFALNKLLSHVKTVGAQCLL